MIKVLGGKYKGRKLYNLKIKNVRPTKSRVKKSIMDTIMDFDGKKILDLFAGVGSLGIESISRGASFVCFVEKNYKTTNLIKKNLDMLNVDNNYEIVSLDVFAFINKTKDKFDIIFADPPYYSCDFEQLLEGIKPLLKNNGVFCFESEYNKSFFKSDLDVRKYGSTQVVYWRNV